MDKKIVLSKENIISTFASLVEKQDKKNLKAIYENHHLILLEHCNTLKYSDLTITETLLNNLYTPKEKYAPHKEKSLPLQALCKTILAIYEEKKEKKRTVEEWFTLAIGYEQGWDNNGDANTKKIDQLYKSALKQKNSEISFFLGKLYFSGEKILKNVDKAFQLFSRSAELEYPPAMTNLGLFYMEGLNNITQDYKKALLWFTKAVNKSENEIFAMSCIGILYKNGLGGIKQDYKTAIKCLAIASNKGELVAMTHLGIIYMLGLGTKKNELKAFQLFELPAENNDTVAMTNRGVIYMNGSCIEKNYQKAFELFIFPASQGNVCALTNLGKIYQFGLNGEKNIETAIEYYEKSSENGGVDATLALGDLYRTGWNDTPPELQKSFKYYKKATKLDENNFSALYNLAVMYINGYGCEQNLKEAIKLNKRVLEMKNNFLCANAAFDLAKIYTREYNFTEAEKYYPLVIQYGEKVLQSESESTIQHYCSRSIYGIIAIAAFCLEEYNIVVQYAPLAIKSSVEKNKQNILTIFSCWISAITELNNREIFTKAEEIFPTLNVDSDPEISDQLLLLEEIVETEECKNHHHENKNIKIEEEKKEIIEIELEQKNHNNNNNTKKINFQKEQSQISVKITRNKIANNQYSFLNYESKKNKTSINTLSQIEDINTEKYVPCYPIYKEKFFTAFNTTKFSCWNISETEFAGKDENLKKLFKNCKDRVQEGKLAKSRENKQGIIVLKENEQFKKNENLYTHKLKIKGDNGKGKMRIYGWTFREKIGEEYFDIIIFDSWDGNHKFNTIPEHTTSEKEDVTKNKGFAPIRPIKNSKDYVIKFIGCPQLNSCSKNF